MTGLARNALRRLPAYALFGCAAATLVGASVPGSAEEQPTPDQAVMRLMADAILIDARCREVTVDFGALAAYGRDHGLPVADILPLGVRRAGFEAATAARSAEVSTDALCSSVMAEDRSLAPGVVKSP